MFHILRHSKCLPKTKLQTLAAVLDFAAGANAAFDGKTFCLHEFQATFQSFSDAGIRSLVIDYLQRLRELEVHRPSPNGSQWQFCRVAKYREAVVRLSLGLLVTIVNERATLEAGMDEVMSDDCLKLLFQIVMQCQIIDDVLDYSQDVVKGLPSFMTASQSLSQALQSTRQAASAYAATRISRHTGELFTLQIALFVVWSCARLVFVVARVKYRRVLVDRLEFVHNASVRCDKLAEIDRPQWTLAERCNEPDARPTAASRA